MYKLVLHNLLRRFFMTSCSFAFFFFCVGCLFVCFYSSLLCWYNILTRNALIFPSVCFIVLLNTKTISRYDNRSPNPTKHCLVSKRLSSFGWIPQQVISWFGSFFTSLQCGDKPVTWDENIFEQDSCCCCCSLFLVTCIYLYSRLTQFSIF